MLKPQFLLASFIAVSCCTGCVYRVEEAAPPLSLTTVSQNNEPPGQQPDPAPQDGSQQGNGAKKIVAPQNVKQRISIPDFTDVPSGLLIATCDSEPDEVAVPLKAGQGRFCDTVQAVAYRQDNSGSYAVHADFTWEIADASLAFFLPPSYGSGKSSRRLGVLYDLFSSADAWVEPQTKLTVCAVPPVGASQWYDPLCSQLPIRAVVNVEGVWCFSGATFKNDCLDVTFGQDGRNLFVDNSILSQGRVWARSINFARDDFAYDGVLDSSDFIYGVVRKSGEQEVWGTWTASRVSGF